VVLPGHGTTIPGPGTCRQGLSAAQLNKILAAMAAQTSGVLAVNFLTEDIDREAVEAAARVRIVDFFWADPDRELVELAHRGGALACWQVGSLEEARAAADAGCDVLAVQGIEAGGHIRGQEPLMPLLESVLGQLEMPVLAAGGIGDGRAFAAVLSTGAAGARVGTRFIATDESGAHPAYRQAVADAVADATEITGAFSLSPVRDRPAGAGTAIMHSCAAQCRRRHGRGNHTRRPASLPPQGARAPAG
jgi:nitronate monooxygenase